MGRSLKAEEEKRLPGLLSIRAVTASRCMILSETIAIAALSQPVNIITLAGFAKHRYTQNPKQLFDSHAKSTISRQPYHTLIAVIDCYSEIPAPH